MNLDLEALYRSAQRAQALAIGADQDIERAEEAHRQLMRKLRTQQILAAQAHWDAQIALTRAQGGSLTDLIERLGERRQQEVCR